MKKEIIVYSDPNCNYCKDLKSVLDKEKISFTEKLTTEFADDWAKVMDITWMPILPTIVINDDSYIAPRRDFQTVQQGVELIKRVSNIENNTPKDIRILESIKSLQYNINNLHASFNAINAELQKKGTNGATPDVKEQTKENNKKE